MFLMPLVFDTKGLRKFEVSTVSPLYVSLDDEKYVHAQVSFDDMQLEE